MQLSLYRFIIGGMIVASLAMVGKASLKFSNVLGLVWRGLVGGLSVVLYFVSINGVGLAKSSLINYSYPFFAIIFSAVFLKEKPGRLVWILLVPAFGGLALLNLPALTSGGWSWMLAVAWSSAILAGVAVTLIKRLTETDSATSIFLAQCLGGFWIMIIPANLEAAPAGWLPALIILAVGIAAAGGQIIMTWSFKHVDVSTGSLLGTIVPVLNVLAAVVLFGERFAPIEALGAALTLGACFALVFAKGRKPVA